MKHIDTRASIRTKYLGPTNYLGGRVSVTDASVMGEPTRRLITQWDHALDVDANHAAAAQEWLDKHMADFAEKYNQRAVVSGPGLCFDGCFYWSWAWEDLNPAAA